MNASTPSTHREPWNKGKLVGQKAPFKLKEIWAIRVRLQLQHRARDLALFVRLSKIPRPAQAIDTPITIVTPAFMISELKRAFEIGFLLFVPFLVIDLVVASVLMSMGMMMLPPVTVSLPFKLIFFVLVDGWRLVCGSLVESFHPR